MFRGKTMVPCGALLSAGAAALWIHIWSLGPPKTTAHRDVIEVGDGFGIDHPSAAPTRFRDSRLSQAFDQLQAASEEDLPVTLEKIVSSWPEHEIRNTVAKLLDLPADNSRSEILRGSLVDRWSRLDPSSAAMWASSLPESSNHLDTITKVALIWNESNPAEAWDWALSLTPESTRQPTLLALGYEVTRADPALALDRLSVLENGPDRLRFIEHAISNLAATDPDGALNRTSQLNDPVEKNHAMAALAIAWSESVPFAAATLAVEEMAAGPEQDRAFVAVTQRWAQQDPDAARAWVEEFPDGPLKAGAMEQIMQQAAAATELNRLPDTK
jgi:hypothetical protein